MHMTEKHRHISPVCVDVDLRHTPTEQSRRYCRGHVERVVVAYARALARILGPDRVVGQPFYVLEKAGGPRPDKRGFATKDGFHLMAPGIVARNAALHLARLDALEELRTVFLEMASGNTLEEAFDEAVISKNNWFMYGSNKPGEPHAYKATRALACLPDFLVCEDVTVSCDLSDATLVDVLSIRNKYVEVPVLAEHVARVEEFDSLRVSEERKRTANKIIIGTTAESFETFYGGDDLARVRDVAMLLSDRRCATYDSWIRLGWCLKNVDESLLDVWIALSKRAPEKFVEGECERLWYRMRRGTLGVGTLHMWAKADDPEGYRELKSTSTHELVLGSLTGTHHDIACVVFSMFRHRFVCSSIRMKQWYEFSGHRWITSDSGTTLRRKLSTDVWAEFSEAVTRFNQRALASSDANDQHDQQEKAKSILKVAQRLKETLFKDYIMKECAEMFYEAKFEERLDSNVNIIGFENGVYDLDADEFRQGRPEDYLTFSTGNCYVEYDENSQAANGVQRYLAQVLTKPDMREYVMKLFASFLHGATKEQKFYVWTGSGANSKSKLIELFELAFGDYCCKLPVTLLTQKRAASNAATSEVAKAKGKRFACMQEPSEDEKMNVGLMKELSGGDKIMARCIYKEPIEFKPQFKMVLLCNHLPEVPSDDGGTWRRIRVVEFTSKFVERVSPNCGETQFPIDTGLSDKLVTWKETFMALLIKTYRRYVDEGIEEPNDVMKCTMEYKRQNDHMTEFIESRIERDENAFMVWADVVAECKAYSRENNVFKVPTRGTFEKYVERALNAKIVAVNGIRGIKGFRVGSRLEMVATSDGCGT